MTIKRDYYVVHLKTIKNGKCETEKNLIMAKYTSLPQEVHLNVDFGHRRC